MKQKRLIFSDLSKDELIDKLVDLDDRFEELLRQVLEKDKRIKELENQIGRNSQNSSKPPSTDGFKKSRTKSSRTKSEKTTGGQVGHKGSTLQQVDNPDIVQNYDVSECFSCKSDLTNIEAESIIRRQEVEIPQVKAVVTEHRISCKTCPKCKAQNIIMTPRN
jgi:transposase